MALIECFPAAELKKSAETRHKQARYAVPA
jgi:hypothetical protein